MCLVPFGPISRVWSKNACSVARVVCQEPPEPCTTLKGTWTLCVLTDHRTEGGVAKGEKAKKNVVSIKGLGSSSPPLRHDPLLKTHTPRSGLGLRPKPLASCGAVPRRARRPLGHLTPPGGGRRGRLLLARGTGALPPRRWRTRALAHQATLADMAHEGRGRRRPALPAGHAPTEGGGERIREGRHRRETRAPRGCGPLQACPPGSWPSLRSCALPSGRFPSPPMPCPPRPLRLRVVDLGRHHSMRQRRLATPMPMDRAARSGKLAWPWGAGSGHARVPGCVPVWRSFRCMKEPFQRLVCPMKDNVWPIRSCSRPPKHTTKAWDTCTGRTAPPSHRRLL